MDALRGLIMIVMALDHANLFIAHSHPRPESWSGQFPMYTSALTFLTRFVTHLAAPGFFFLMGAGMALFADARRRAGWNTSAIARRFIERGLLLIALQLLVEDPAWQIAAILRGEGSVFPIYFGVLYGLGAAMMAAALTLNLNSTLIAGLSLAALLAPEFLIPDAGPWLSSPLLQLLLVPGQTSSLLVYYPVIPWLGLAGFGMVFGRWLLQDQARAYRRAMIIGGVMLALFFVIRSPGGFGNIRPADSAGWISFLNVVKYPPSLVFVLLTLGLDLLLLSLCVRAERGWERWLHPLVVLGQGPLFFYVTHLYLYGLIGFAFFPNGIGIPKMYPIWLAGLVVLFFMCQWYGNFKRRQPLNSLWRFV